MADPKETQLDKERREAIERSGFTEEQFDMRNDPDEDGIIFIGIDPDAPF